MYATDGDAVDYQFIRAQALRDAEQFRVDSVNVDRLFQGYQLMMELAQDGLNVISYTMGIMSITTPMKELEIRLMKRGINHGNNPAFGERIKNGSMHKPHPSKTYNTNVKFLFFHGLSP